MPATLHRYAYVRANPSTFKDPSGLFDAGSFSISAGLSGMIDAAATTSASVALAIKTLIVGGVLLALLQPPMPPSGSFKVYRGMKADIDGRPTLGPSKRTLGAVPGEDIPVDAGGNVHPSTEGMSVSPESPWNLPIHRRPPEYGGTGKDPVWSLHLGWLQGEFGLKYAPDLKYPGKHGFVEPVRTMPFDEYQGYIADTRGFWIRH